MAAEPIEQFEQWFTSALSAGYPEPNAMVVATVDANGYPQSRNVLLKAFDERGFVFYTNYNSDKGREMIARPQVGLTFSWIELHRQIRIVGLAEKLSDDESDAYFATRPRGSQVGAWTSPQSSVIADRAALESLEAQMVARFMGDPVPRPDHWGGFLIRHATVEFWQGRPNRLHDRIRYTRTANSTWTKTRLAP